MAIKDDEAREAYFEMQAIEQQMRQLSQQISLIENQIQDFQNSIEAVSSLKSKTGEEIFVPVCSGVYAKAELRNDDKFIVNVGANVAVEKTGESAMEIIRKQIGDMGIYKDQMVRGMELLEARAKEIQKRVLEN